MSKELKFLPKSWLMALKVLTKQVDVLYIQYNYNPLLKSRIPKKGQEITSGKPRP